MTGLPRHRPRARGRAAGWCRGAPLLALLLLATPALPDAPPFSRAALAPWLTELSGDDLDVRREAVFELIRLGPLACAVRPEAERGLAHPDAEVRGLSIRLLGSLREPATLPALIAQLSATDAEVRFAAVWALARHAPASRLAARALIGALADPEPRVRIDVAFALGYFGPLSDLVVPALIRALPDPAAGMYACDALAHLGRRDPRTVAALLARWDAMDDFFARKALLQAIAAVAPAPDEVLRRCVGALSTRAAGAAAEELGRLGSRARPAIPALSRIAAERDAYRAGVAIEALARIGARESLVRLYRRSPGRTGWHLRRQLIAAVRDHGVPATRALLHEALADPAPDHRQSAWKGLARLGAPAAWLPELVRHLEREADPPGIADVGRRLTSDTPAPLLALLPHPSRSVRELAATALGSQTAAVATVRPALLERLDVETNAAVRAALAGSLEGLARAPDAPPLPSRSWRHAALRRAWRPRREATLPGLLDLLADGAPAERVTAAQALGELGACGGPATRALAQRLGDDDLRVRRAVAVALGRIGRPARGALPALRALTDAAEPALRRAVVDAILALAPGDEHALAQRQALRARTLRTLAAELHARRDLTAVAARLGALGPQARPLLPALVDAAAASWETRAVLEDAARAIGPPRLKDVPALIERSRERLAIELLGRLGPLAAAAVPTLVRALADDLLVDAAALALLRIGPAARPAAAALRQLLDSERASITSRRDAAEALGRIGAREPATLTRLRRTLAAPDRRPLTRAAAGLALWRLTGDAAPVVARLGPMARWTPDALEALVEIGAPALPALIALLDAAPRVALSALVRLGPAAAPAVPRVRALLRHDTDAIRMAAMDALVRIEPVTPTTVAALLAGVEEAEQHVVWGESVSVPTRAAITALGRLQRLPPALAYRLWEKDRSRHLLYQATHDTAGAVRAIRRVLADRARRVDGVVGALDWLAARGPAGASLSVEVASCLTSPSAEIRTSARRALVALGAAATPAIPTLVSQLGGGDARVGDLAIDALEAIGPAAAPALTGVLSAPAPLSRARAARLLGQLGDRTARPALARLRTDPVLFVRLYAAAAEALLAAR